MPDDFDPPGDGPSDGEPSRGDSSQGELSQGDGAARVPLSEAITAVLDVLTECSGNLEAIRHRLRQEELPEELDVNESDLPQPAEQARHVAARLDTCIGALQNGSG